MNAYTKSPLRADNALSILIIVASLACTTYSAFAAALSPLGA